MKISYKCFPLFYVFNFLMCVHKISIATDTITTTRFLRDGETMLSSEGTFELGFFSPGNSKNRYVGMWYKKITVTTIVWVANREVPLIDTSGVLKVVQPGLLVLLNHTNGGIVWSSNTSQSAKAPEAKLLDSGNLIVKDANDGDQGNILWESFHYPTDTLLPGMKLGVNFITGLEVYLSPWFSKDDPSSGDFTYHLDPTGYPQLVLKKGSSVQFKSGPWNGLSYSGTPNLRKNPIFKYGIVLDRDEAYYTYELLSETISRFTIGYNGVAQRWMWVNRTQEWVVYLTIPTDNCDIYKSCGAYGRCNVGNSPVCGCIKGFEPKDQAAWDRVDWSDGCVRKTPLNCQKGDVFIKYSGIKVPDTQYSWYNETMTLDECKAVCLKNCNCSAYTQLNISTVGSGCLLWFGDLVDIRELSDNGQDLYIRMASSELHLEGRRRVILEVSLSLLMGMVLLGICLIMYLQKRKKSNNKLRKEGRLGQYCRDDPNHESRNKDLELPMFDLSTVTKATDDFSSSNKLGEGGFGPVYRVIE